MRQEQSQSAATTWLFSLKVEDDTAVADVIFEGDDALNFLSKFNVAGADLQVNTENLQAFESELDRFVKSRAYMDFYLKSYTSTELLPDTASTNDRESNRRRNKGQKTRR
jgi:hypothetical protein